MPQQIVFVIVACQWTGSYQCLLTKGARSITLILPVLGRVPHSQIEDIVTGRQTISANTGLRLSRVFGMSDGFWVGLQANYDAAKARQRLSTILERIQPFPHHLNPQT
ncbi:MAG: HigA family addiction module antidote protein [Chromatiaceae bacterium]|nr:HigA family addiction module antidote protein [Chromatiaceae bacterium]MCF8004986.1 HigA family addiction module antidote protein [Chromatiaceae bacterium]